MVESLSARTTKNRSVIDHADRIFSELQDIQGETGEKVRTVLERVFADQQIQREFDPGSIRHTAMCGEVARELLEMLNELPDLIGLLSIGDVTLPEFAKPTIMGILERAHKHHMELVEEEGCGYDLASRGSEKARRALIEYFDKYYHFPPTLKEALVKNSCITLGGMRALDDIASGIIKSALAADQVPFFIHPDNSFGTWHQITALRSNNGRTAEIHAIPTEQRNLLHLQPKQVDEFYASNPAQSDRVDTWYITPVGNPSGTKTETLASTCKAVIKNNPNAVIILDCVYVRTLIGNGPKELMGGVFNDPEVIQRVIFVESFSKTHGICGERAGTYFSANREIFDRVQNVNMTLSAGNGRYRSALSMALAESADEEEQVIRRLHRFWADERKGLYKYLIKSGNFTHVFDENQSHIQEKTLGNPMGLYVFLKLREGVDGKQVLMETGCLGVLTKMGSGTYIRFAVGKITEPTYSKY